MEERSLERNQPMSAILVRDSDKKPPKWITSPPTDGTWRYVMHNEYGEMMVVDFSASNLSLLVASEDNEWRSYIVRDLKSEKLAVLRKSIDPDCFLRVVISDDAERGRRPNGLIVTPAEARFLLAILSILKD